MIKTQNIKSKGYTIIETMISLSIFIIVILTGMSALLNANLVHQKSQDMRSILDNLSFIMEDISRNIRTGYNYRCISGIFSNTSISTAQSCNLGGAMAFESDVGNSESDADQWVYKIEGSGGTYNISKSTDGGNNFTQLNLNEINIDSTSGFSVLGAPSPTAGDSQQPLVIIKLSGKITFKDIVTPFSLQTSVSQRIIDI